MNPETLINYIQSKVHGTTAVSLDTVTEVRMVKKHRITKEPNPYLGVRKHQTKNGLIGFDYSNSVNYQAEREDKEHRTIKERSWGTLSEDRIFVLHKGRTYLQLKLQSVSDTWYELDGKEIDYTDIEPYLSGSSGSSTQADLEKEVVVNDINMENIHCIRMFGEEICVSA